MATRMKMYHLKLSQCMSCCNGVLSSNCGQCCPQPTVGRVLDANDDLVIMTPKDDLHSQLVESIGAVHSALVVQS